ncbi:MAG: CapA family protein [Clostridia bacterium]|nr:CapA family protein [Clostridia bacterium]
MHKRRINYRRLLVSISLLLGLVCIVWLAASALHKSPGPSADVFTPIPSPVPEASITPTPEPTPVPTPTPSPTPFNGTRSISFTFTGDIMVHEAQLKGAYDRVTGTYSFDKNFDFVLDRLSKADFTIGNL